MLITKRRLELKLENVLSKKKSNFLPILAKIIPRTLQLWRCHGNSGCPMGLVCTQNESVLVYGKSQEVSASHCLPFQHSRGKSQPLGRFRPPRPV